MTAATDVLATAKKRMSRRQRYPATLIKPGVELYSAYAYTDDDRKTKTGFDVWVVRSIRAKRGSQTRMGFETPSYLQDTTQYVNLTQKEELVTWGKVGGKLGWLPSIPDEYRRQFAVGDSLPLGIFTTKRAALVYLVRDVRDTIARYDEWIEEETSDAERQELRCELEDYQAELRALSARLTKLEKLKKAKATNSSVNPDPEAA